MGVQFSYVIAAIDICHFLPPDLLTSKSIKTLDLKSPFNLIDQLIYNSDTSYNQESM